MTARGIHVVDWDVTAQCDLRCRHCYAAALYQGEGRELSTLEARVVLDNLLNVGMHNLIFYGGEPLYRQDLTDLATIAVAAGTRSYVVTNGLLLTANRAEGLLEAGVSGIAISLDAATAATYQQVRGRKGSDFRRVLANGEHLAARLREVGTSTRASFTAGFVVSRLNYREIEDFIILAHRIGADQVIFTHLAWVGMARWSWPADVILSPQELVEAAGMVARVQAAGCLPKDFVTLDFATHTLVEYVNRRYGASLALPARNCRPLKGNLFVRADGVAFPCKGAVRELGLKDSTVYHSPGHSLLECALSDVLASDDFGYLFGLAAPTTLAAGLPGCRGCPAFLECCTPCPIAVAAGKRYAEFCHDYPIGEICQAVRKLQEAGRPEVSQDLGRLSGGG